MYIWQILHRLRVTYIIITVSFITTVLSYRQMYEVIRAFFTGLTNQSNNHDSSTWWMSHSWRIIFFMNAYTGLWSIQIGVHTPTAIERMKTISNTSIWRIPTVLNIGNIIAPIFGIPKIGIIFIMIRWNKIDRFIVTATFFSLQCESHHK